MSPSTDALQDSEAPGKKPRFALAIATAFGVGYIPKAPGTFGSLVGVLLILLTTSGLIALPLLDAGIDSPAILGHVVPAVLLFTVLVFLLVALAGIWSASCVASFAGTKDPQYVVIDEVSGQHLTLLIGSGFWALANWKCLLLGFILFRVFDIWKPYPVRQLEKLPGGWGIMADDWMAGIYAAICLRVALHFGLV